MIEKYSYLYLDIHVGKVWHIMGVPAQVDSAFVFQ